MLTAGLIAKGVVGCIIMSFVMELSEGLRRRGRADGRLNNADMPGCATFMYFVRLGI